MPQDLKYNLYNFVFTFDDYGEIKMISEPVG
jgi:hypothetical protein